MLKVFDIIKYYHRVNGLFTTNYVVKISVCSEYHYKSISLLGNEALDGDHNYPM